MREIYLDNAATTAVIPEAMAAAQQAMAECYGNPGSVHAKGRQASLLLGACRKKVAAAVGCEEGCITFTSGGSESINTALRGAALKNKHLGRHIITTQIEHDATLNTLRQLEQEGFEVTYVAPQRDGSVTLQSLIDAMREVGEKMDVSLRETGLGGVAATPFGQAVSEKMSGQ